MKGATVLAAVAVALLVGCGGDDDAKLTVSAAASLKPAFEAYDPDGRYSFAGSDELAARIRSGARPDVYAAANTELPAALHREGLTDRPVTFASNRLVIATRGGQRAIRRIGDLARRGTKLAIGSPSVPVGRYTREVLDRLAPAQTKAILANVRSNEPDVAGVVGKVAQGAVDAGLVYVTDVRASKGRLVAVALPDDLQPSVAYAVAVVRGTERRDEARAFVDGLVRGRGQEALRDSGFEPPPG